VAVQVGHLQRQRCCWVRVHACACVWVCGGLVVGVVVGARVCVCVLGRGEIAPRPQLQHHSTAQHSTAQHSTAQHSTAQHPAHRPPRCRLQLCDAADDNHLLAVLTRPDGDGRAPKPGATAQACVCVCVCVCARVWVWGTGGAWACACLFVPEGV
jgi:hypothetical protein